MKKNIKELKGELSALTIGTEKYQSTLTSLIANQNALRNAMNGTSASLEDVAQAAVGTVNSYNGLVAKMAELNREFRSMDTASDEGKARMRELGAEINAVNEQLKSMDALRGNYQRNVGNYRSALNGLNIAMAQVVRELPSMAISANTFFLAISNNIPILVDQIANLRAQNELALARGEKTVSVLGAVVKSLFSWNTVLTLDGEEADDLIERVGFRTVEVRDTKIYLNGAPIYLKGFNRHEDYAVDGCAVSLQHMVQDMDMMQDLRG